MSSVTAVPLQPIAKGSLIRLWVGVVIVLLLGALLAWVGLRQFGRTPDGVSYQMLKVGEGPNPTKDDVVLVGYKLSLPDGKVIQENAGAPMDLSEGIVPGFVTAVTLLNKGGHLRANIPANLAYGDHPPPNSGIPAGSPLIFDLKLLDFKTREEMMEIQRQRQMQQMLQQQGAGGGAPQGAAPQP